MNIFSHFREGEAKDSLTRYEHSNIPEGLGVFLGDIDTVQTCVNLDGKFVLGFRGGGVFMLTKELSQTVFLLQAPPTPIRVEYQGQEVFDVRKPQNNLRVTKAILNKYGISQVR